MSLNLSKSKYCSAVQCPKMLWLKKNKPDAFDDSVMNQSVLDTGNEVGDLAMGLFGDFTEVPFGDLSDMIKKTEELVASGEPIITEASFAHEGLFCSVDILKNLGNKCVEMYEVKSSTSVKDIYYDDTAYQYYVLTKLGYTVNKVCIVYVNNQYVRSGELDIQQMFITQDLTDKAKSKLSEVEAKVAELDAYMQNTEEPDDRIGTHCFSPYDCGFFGHCTRDLPKPNVFDLSGARNTTKFKYYNNGDISFEALNAIKSLNAGQRMQVEHELTNCAPHIEKEPIKGLLDELSYPLYFLDFETFMPAIPLYDNSHPYEQIPFQYSLHYIEQVGGELKHTEFLADPKTDPRRALAEQLCKDIPKDVCVTAYNMSFEKSRIKSLAEMYPDLADHLMKIYDHVHDLMVPFQKKYYYTKAMQGSYSIKFVLPALFPNDPELDYHNLEGVHNGAEASAVFKQMLDMSDEEIEVTRTNLLKYCGLDTFAMVKVWEKLNQVVGINLKVSW